MTKIWVGADTHFDHKAIMTYCNRPFKTVTQMNHLLVMLWNESVNPNDYVIFLGDLALSGMARQWFDSLNGIKVMIKGNHDRFGIESMIVNADGLRLLMIHNPYNVKQGDCWVIHGHNHNGPVIDRDNKRVNVCLDNTGYKPVELSKVVSCIKGDCNGLV